ncbi:MAG: hypothetical protein ACK5LO_07640 [Leucobacter sp.]
MPAGNTCLHQAQRVDDRSELARCARLRHRLEQNMCQGIDGKNTWLQRGAAQV